MMTSPAKMVVSLAKLVVERTSKAGESTRRNPSKSGIPMIRKTAQKKLNKFSAAGAHAKKGYRTDVIPVQPATMAV
jgi:hypothetical protein